MTLHTVAVAEFVRKSSLGDFQIFVVSGRRQRAASIGTIRFYFSIGYPENAKCPPDKNGVSCSSHKVIGKLAYLGVKMTSLD